MSKLAVPLVAIGIALAAQPLSAQAPAPAATQAAARAPRQSWLSDRRDFTVGDIITVLLDEYTLASKNQGDANSDRRSRDASVSVGQNVVASLPDVGADFGTHNDAESRRLGESTRQTRFQSEMTVRVTAVEAGGRLRIEGKKVVNVDKNREEILLKGWVRAQDVQPNNSVESFRIGNAELVYNSRGSLGKPKGGIISRLLGALWP